MSNTEFPEPPEEFLRYPAGNVIALMTDGDAVAAALDDLTRAGFPRDKMYVLVGPAGAERLDVTGQHHGLRGRVYRTLRQVGDEHEELLRAANHLQAGGLAVRVPADKDEKAVAARILGEHGAAHISSIWGRRRTRRLTLDTSGDRRPRDNMCRARALNRWGRSH
jgi:hypothetical protein